ncbi:trypsin-like peptidase domain-containing protein [Saccharopolyspora spinosa]|uniref:Trypsin-like peptidase n=1 Tax=Saccharopolyspora spinosa TaxID=60894 RepID=A0A2N3Y6U4_SACSN|nr:trypsin-like peptidase domain-containing protein [Saccharopolyspora spinosa]PKW18601.1 trypsin-like peptidase [Saccharopolyspora spinosa]
MSIAADLKEHLQGCVVRLSGTGLRGGSGFFVAPGYVLTCAHVVDGQVGRQVAVTWNGDDHSGSVVWSGPRADRTQQVWPHPDLAVVQVPVDSPCVWLDENVPDYDADLFASGHARLYGPREERRPAALTSPGLIELGDVSLLRISGDELPDGMSGGPVLDLTTGAVCGVVKTARARNAPHGGVAVPVRALRELPPDLLRELWRGHDRYHASSGPWPGLLDRMSDRRSNGLALEEIVDPKKLQPVLRPTEISELRSLLADLPVAGDLNEVYRLACGPAAPRLERPLLDWRDVVGALDDIAAAARGALHPLLAFAELTARRCHQPDVAGGLDGWARRVATRLGQRAELGQYDPPDRVVPHEKPMAVIAKVEASAHDQDRYLLTIWLYRRDEDFEVFFADEDPRPLPDALAGLKNLLPGALNLLDGGPDVLVEFVLPRQLLNEPVDEWQIWPTRRFARLGRRHPVVVRALSEDDDPYSRKRGEERWQWLTTQDTVPWNWIHCEDKRDQEILYAWFEESTGHAALGLPGPPETDLPHEALVAGLFAGLRVAVWRRTRCEDHDLADFSTQPCAGDRFRDELSGKLLGVNVAQLPRVVKDLRNAAAQQVGTEHCGRDVVLLWDLGRRPEAMYLQSLVPLA